MSGVCPQGETTAAPTTEYEEGAPPRLATIRAPPLHFLIPAQRPRHGGSKSHLVTPPGAQFRHGTARNGPSQTRSKWRRRLFLPTRERDVSKPLADLYKPYSFNDIDGPGCGVPEHGPSCLCDVDLAAHPVPQDTAPVMAYASSAHQACIDRGIEPSPLNMIAEVLGLFEAAREAGTRLRVTPERVEELCSEYRSRGGNAGRFARHNVLVQLVEGGLSLRSCAAVIGCPEREVAEQFSTRTTDPEAILRAADMLHAGCHSFYAVATETGLRRGTVVDLAKNLGYESVVTTLLKAGGGYKYSADQFDTVRRMRAEGASYAEIAKATGMKRSAVSMWCSRNLRNAS